MNHGDEHMNRLPVDPALFETMAENIRESCERHRKQYGDEIIELSREVENEYKYQLDRILSVLTKNRRSADVLTPVYHVLRNYLRLMQWVGWGDCEFGPPLGIRCSEQEYSLSILVYLSARLIDDGIDGHTDYKGSVQSLYGYMAGKIKERKAAGLSCLMGNLILNASLRRLYKKGYAESADMLMRIYSDVFPGAFAEALCIGCTVEYDLYMSIIKRKSVAYDMMLHSVFFRSVEPVLRSRILQFLADYSETSQWLNDLCDEEDDFSRGQLNILNVPGMDRDLVFNRIVKSFYSLWKNTSDLLPALRDVIAIRLQDSFKKFLEIQCDEIYKKPFRNLTNS